MSDLEITTVEGNIGNDQGADNKHKSVQLTRLAEHLEYCCQQQKTITYLEAADAIDVEAPQRIHQVTELLEALMEHDHEHGQPIRAALVVSRGKTGLPGDGFFLKAQALGLMSGAIAEEFHQQCLNRLFDTPTIKHNTT